jgi:hypothetical protein
MAYQKYLTIGVIALSLLFNACHSDKGNSANFQVNNDSTAINKKVSVIISSIPFPIDILDTLHDLNMQFHGNLLNPVANAILYSESNAQAINLGLYGADLAYVISFEQFQNVGDYMKVSKFLADNLGIPLAFTAQVIARCEKNQNNKDSLSHIVLQAYTQIDQTLKQAERNSSEVLVLTGGWLEGIYFTTESVMTMPDGRDKQRVLHILIGQKQYADKLISLLNQVSRSCTYCQDVATRMQELGLILDEIKSEADFTDQKVKAIADKVNLIRALVVKGNT